MARITIEDCTERIPNRFALVLTAGVRTKQLMRGARSFVKPGENKFVVTSLREIAQGKICPDVEVVDRPSSKRAGS